MVMMMTKMLLIKVYYNVFYWDNDRFPYKTQKPWNDGDLFWRLGLTSRRTDGQTDGRTDGWMNGQTDRWIDKLKGCEDASKKLFWVRPEKTALKNRTGELLHL